jgi:predicted nuclease of predicted toxin-antitoxin system
MKILLDTCVWGGVREALRARCYDVIWTGEWESDPGDEEILELANAQGRILVTLDKDFGELAIVQQKPHCGIVRLVDFSARDQATICMQVLERYETELLKGALVTAEPGRIRIRPAESPDQ